MYAKTIVAFTAFAALAEQAVAFNSHRHLHRRNIEKRDVVTDWVTVYETVGADQDSEPAPTVFVAEVPAPSPQTTLITAVQPAPKASPPPAVAVVNAPPVSQAPVPAPAPSPTPTPKPASPQPTSNGAVSNKRGIAYNDAGLGSAFGAGCQKCGWAYNWGSSSQGLNSKVDYIPMLWGPKPQFTQNWDSDVTKALAGGAKTIFSFNEPDNAGQCNMSPQDAAKAHIQYLNKYAGKALIGAPSVTNSGNAGEGIQWLSSFMSACNGECQVDFCNVHWYSEAQYADTLFSHLDAAYKACGGKPIYLTEFATIGDQSQTPDFLRKVIPKLDSLDYLHGYSYFMVESGDGKLMGNGNSLSDIGQLYASL